MAGYYDLIRDYVEVDEKGNPLLPEHVSVSPHVVMAVVRLNMPVTFSREKMASISNDSSVAAGTRGDTLILTSDVLNLTISGDKGNHLKSLGASLLSGETNYLSEILPGDWIMAWMMNDADKAAHLVDYIKQGKACNEFDDGFKFLGRVASIGKASVKERAGGMLTTRYRLQASGFHELDSSVYYDPHLAENHTSMNSWLGKLNKALSDLIDRPAGDENDPGAISINKVIPYFLDLLVGDGITKRFSNPGNDKKLQIATGAGSGEAPFAYLVPKAIGDLLGKQSRNASKAGGILAYADILELVYGLQRYQTSATSNSNNKSSVFVPDGVSDKGNPHKYTNRPMMGLFTPDIPSFTGKSVWSIMYQWLNPVVNEMFTCLRVNNSGKIVPTVILRQQPFSTDLLANKKKNEGKNINAQGEFGPAEGPPSKLPEVTPFLELPRWRMHPTLVWEVDYGRSDALRFNFVQVFGQSAASQSNANMSYQNVRNPPVRDELDIQRSGLRMYQAAIACSYKETREGPRAWMEVASDFMMGQQLAFTGTINCFGIQSPICEGDNLEFDDTVFHIEAVTHQYNRDPGTGKGTFITSLSLTHGMRSDSQNARDEAQGLSKELGIYPGITINDQRTYEPGLTIIGDGSQAPLTPDERKKRDDNYTKTLNKGLEDSGISQRDGQTVVSFHD